jgi:hypothetical protein
MAMIEGEQRPFGACDVGVAERKIEPRPEIRSDIARIYLYMEVLSTLAPLRSEDVGQLVGLELCRRHHSHQVSEALAMNAPALRKCERFVAVRPGAEKPSELVKDVAETRSGGERFEPVHGTVPLFHIAMVLLQVIIHVAVRPVPHPLPEHVPYGARVQTAPKFHLLQWGMKPTVSDWCNPANLHTLALIHRGPHSARCSALVTR